MSFLLVALMELAISSVAAVSLLSHGLPISEAVLLIIVFITGKYSLKLFALWFSRLCGWPAAALSATAFVLWGLFLDLNAYVLAVELFAQLVEAFAQALWESAVEDWSKNIR